MNRNDQGDISLEPGSTWMTIHVMVREIPHCVQKETYYCSVEGEGDPSLRSERDGTLFV
jgi:hypothetical protein